MPVKLTVNSLTVKKSARFFLTMCAVSVDAARAGFGAAVAGKRPANAVHPATATATVSSNLATAVQLVLWYAHFPGPYRTRQLRSSMSEPRTRIIDSKTQATAASTSPIWLRAYARPPVRSFGHDFCNPPSRADCDTRTETRTLLNIGTRLAKLLLTVRLSV